MTLAIETEATTQLPSDHLRNSLAAELARTIRFESERADPRGFRAAEAALALLDRATAPTAVLHPAYAAKAWWEDTPFVVSCDEFLAPGELADLRDYVLAHKNDFKPATLVDAHEGRVFVDQSFRLSETLFVLGPFRSLFERRVARYLDFVCSRVDRPLFERPVFEVQLTATRNGGFFRAHDDNSHPGNRSRRITFVHYFFLEQFRRSGGALRFYLDNPTRSVDLLPVHNRVVFFDSSLRHEVRPFVSESDAFEASRFTVNGWVHQEIWK